MKSVIAALAANLAIAIAKFAAFFLTGSASLLAEAIHSVADTGNEILLLIGGAGRGGRGPPSTRSGSAGSGSSTPSWSP